MRLMWFHLMPYTELPDDFRDKHPSVWVDIHSSLFDPKPRASHVQRLHGRTRIRRRLRLRRGLRERASLQRLWPDAVAQPDRLVAGAAHHRHRDLRHGQFARAVQPADARRRRIRHDRLHLRRPADRRLSGRLADGHLLRLWAEPVAAARSLPRGARPDHARLDRSRHLRLQRPLQPAALREHLAAPDPDAASADLDAGRRLGRDLAVVRRDGLRLLLSVAITATRPAAPTMDGFWDEMARLGKDRNPYRAGFLQIRRRRRKAASRRWSSTPRRRNISTAAACISIRASPPRPATPPKRRSASGCKARSPRPQPTPTSSTSWPTRDG